MRNWIVLCGFWLAMVTAGEAKASLIAVEDAAFTQNLTLDTETGREWMNIREGYLPGGYGPSDAYQVLMQYLSPGGIWEDWTLASAADVLTLFDHAGLPSSIYGFESEHLTAVNPVTAFQTLLGRYYTPAGPWGDLDFTDGIVRDSPAPGYISLLGVESWYDVVYDPDEILDPYTVYLSRSQGVQPFPIADFDVCREYQDFVGAWLYREAEPVPEPSTMVLLGCGIFGLIAWRKRSPEKHKFQ